jgi:hypothetical protein
MRALMVRSVSPAFDTLSRWLIDDEPGFDLRQAHLMGDPGVREMFTRLLPGDHRWAAVTWPADVIARATIPTL